MCTREGFGVCVHEGFEGGAAKPGGRLRFVSQAPIVCSLARATQADPVGVRREKEGSMTTALTIEKAPVLEDYFGMMDAQLHERISIAKRELGSRVVVLGHHYQRDDVICHADFTGDS